MCVRCASSVDQRSFFLLSSLFPQRLVSSSCWRRVVPKGRDGELLRAPSMILQRRIGYIIVLDLEFATGRCYISAAGCPSTPRHSVRARYGSFTLRLDGVKNHSNLALTAVLRHTRSREPSVSADFAPAHFRRARISISDSRSLEFLLIPASQMSPSCRRRETIRLGSTYF